VRHPPSRSPHLSTHTTSSPLACLLHLTTTMYHGMSHPLPRSPYSSQVAIVTNAGTAQLYLDGSAVGGPLSFGSVKAYSTTRPLKLGFGDSHPTNILFAGQMRSYGMWDRSLTPDEVRSLSRDLFSDVSSTSLVAWLPLDTPGSTAVVNLAPNSNAGSRSSSAAVTHCRARYRVPAGTSTPSPVLLSPSSSTVSWGCPAGTNATTGARVILSKLADGSWDFSGPGSSTVRTAGLTCVACPPNTYSFPGGTGCAPCPSGLVVRVDRTGCIPQLGPPDAAFYFSADSSESTAALCPKAVWSLVCP
jgi:hypothetical protein